MSLHCLRLRSLISLLLAALSLLVITASARAAPAAQSGSDPNADCLACHGVPGREMQLLGGETLSVYVDGDSFAHSVHGRKDITCTACHTNISGYPHPPQMARDRRDYQLQNYAACRNCHPEVYDKTLDSMHTKALASGERNAAVCTDCHGAHDVTPPARRRPVSTSPASAKTAGAGCCFTTPAGMIPSLAASWRRTRLCRSRGIRKA
ncbi:MAG: NapC/NirT family cytochrome c [Caldilineales bacterium]|nr:NapC/NirT family cytochrome c [Caldilineales bacterium]